MTWQRLESSTVGSDLYEGQAAPVADAMWMIGRQWQVGELTGDDAATPLLVEAEVEAAPITRFQPGAPSRDLPRTNLEASSLPLEAAVEREAVRTGPTGARLAAEAGLHLFRLLDHHGADPEVRTFLRTTWPLAVPDDDDQDEPGRTELRLLVHRSFDARALRRDDPDPARLGPAGPAALRAWTRWYDALFTEPAPDQTSWQPERLDHRFRVSARPEQDVEVVLDAPEYRGGHLDWHAFDVRSDLALQAEPESLRRRITAIPTRATFAGQAAARWWEMEDADVWFGAIHTGPEDLARIALANFGATFGEDWFVIPGTLPAGHLVRTRRLRVLDSFARPHDIASTAAIDGPDRDWRFFELTGDPAADAVDPGDRTSPWLFVAPAVAGVTESAPREVVVLQRDEVANVGWAVELRIESTTGRVVDRAARARAELERRPPDQSSAWHYHLAGDVPGNYVPLLPVQVDGEAGLYLQRGRLAVASTAADVATQGALGTILEPERQLLVEDAAVPHGGVEVRRSWQLARTRRGGVVTWMGRRTGPPTPRPAPGLIFDEVDRRQA